MRALRCTLASPWVSACSLPGARQHVRLFTVDDEADVHDAVCSSAAWHLPPRSLSATDNDSVPFPAGGFQRRDLFATPDTPVWSSAGVVALSAAFDANDD